MVERGNALQIPEWPSCGGVPGENIGIWREMKCASWHVWCQWKGSRKERGTSRVCVTVIVSLGNCLDVRMILVEHGLMNGQHCVEHPVLNQLPLLKLKGASKAQFPNPETLHGCAGQLPWLLSASYWTQNVDQHLLKLNTLYISQEFWPRNGVSRTKLMHQKNTSNPNSTWRNLVCSPPMANWMQFK